jgi:hypothetical protein
MGDAEPHRPAGGIVRVVLPEVRVVVYHRHGPRCTSQKHRSCRKAAECLWPWAYRLRGDGQWASVSRCGQHPAVQLWPSEAEARRALEEIATFGCGGSCRGHHLLVRIGDELLTGVTH